jgi:hypothetical protein
MTQSRSVSIRTFRGAATIKGQFGTYRHVSPPSSEAGRFYGRHKRSMETYFIWVRSGGRPLTPRVAGQFGSREVFRNFTIALRAGKIFSGEELKRFTHAV